MDRALPTDCCADVAELIFDLRRRLGWFDDVTRSMRCSHGEYQIADDVLALAAFTADLPRLLRLCTRWLHMRHLQEYVYGGTRVSAHVLHWGTTPLLLKAS